MPWVYQYLELEKIVQVFYFHRSCQMFTGSQSTFAKYRLTQLISKTPWYGEIREPGYLGVGPGCWWVVGFDIWGHLQGQCGHLAHLNALEIIRVAKFSRLPVGLANWWWKTRFQKCNILQCYVSHTILFDDINGYFTVLSKIGLRKTSKVNIAPLDHNNRITVNDDDKIAHYLTTAYISGGLQFRLFCHEITNALYPISPYITTHYNNLPCLYIYI